MAVFIKMYQSNRKGSPQQGKWYARVKPIGTKDLKDIAELIQRNASVKRSDVMAVLAELSEVISDMLTDGYRVKIDGLGVFKMAIRTAPADTEKDFSVDKNIKGSHILFQPETQKEGANKRRVRQMAKVIEYKKVNDLTEKKEDKKPKPKP